LVRFVQGAFVGGITASAHALISVNAPADFQGRAFSVSQSATHVGNFLGPLMGGAIASSFGYRAVFPVTALLGLLNLLWVLRGQRQHKSRASC
ncbi:MAG TPA: MFS transporter, partial [Symbiobacteriaceae bacterium]|nr:MFS transporter [Symbiobacteriaceae bacterium]